MAKTTDGQSNGQPTVVRTSRGLTIGGTRLTLYSILDCLKADWPPGEIRDLYRLTERQMADVLAYIEAHRDEVEAEYQQVVRQAEEVRRYWEERNRELLARPLPPPDPHRRAIWEKLRAREERTNGSFTSG
jgi:uncharacterized protein (DUF433 family)